MRPPLRDRYRVKLDRRADGRWYADVTRIDVGGHAVEHVETVRARWRWVAARRARRSAEYRSAVLRAAKLPPNRDEYVIGGESWA